MNLQRDSYSNVWYKTHTSPHARKCPSILLLSELLFSLPFSNGIVERIFSSAKVIKTKKQTNLSAATLKEIKVEGPPPLSNFVANSAVQLWWKDCRTTRRVNQKLPRKTISLVKGI